MTTLNTSLGFANELAATGHVGFTFAEAQHRLGKSPTATANLLKRMAGKGLIDRVCRGHYVLRPLGFLGTPSVAEDVGLAVYAAFGDNPHRLAYRTALYEHDLITHPLRVIQVAAIKRTRSPTLSGWPLRVIVEPCEHIDIGSIAWNNTHISDIERAVLDAAHRPALVGGAEVVAEALGTAASRLGTETLIGHAHALNRSAALRRIGSLADNLWLKGLHGQLEPLATLTADIDLEPGTRSETVWRDSRWRVRWPRTIDELRAVVTQ